MLPCKRTAVSRDVPGQTGNQATAVGCAPDPTGQVTPSLVGPHIGVRGGIPDDPATAGCHCGPGRTLPHNQGTDREIHDAFLRTGIFQAVMETLWVLLDV